MTAANSTPAGPLIESNYWVAYGRSGVEMSGKMTTVADIDRVIAVLTVFRSFFEDDNSPSPKTGDGDDR